jgi:hypothetical protein
LPLGLALFDMIAEKNKRSRMFIVNDAGHFHYREHPQEFARNVSDFNVELVGRPPFGDFSRALPNRPNLH